MKKFVVIFLILNLVLLTAFIKNSTKRTDDIIFISKENLRILNSNKINVIGLIDNFKSNNKNKSPKEQKAQSRDLIDNLLKDNKLLNLKF